MLLILEKNTSSLSCKNIKRLKCISFKKKKTCQTLSLKLLVLNNIKNIDRINDTKELLVTGSSFKSDRSNFIFYMFDV